MKTIKIKLYSFNELSKEAQQKAIEKERNYKYENGDLLFFFKDYCKEQAKDKGFEDIEIQYSLSYSQGDGLSFSAQKFTKLEELFNEVLGTGKEKTAKLIAENCTVIMKGNGGRYCFASKSDIDMYIENYTSSINVTNTNNLDVVVGKVLEKLEDIYIDLCKELEKAGYADIEYETGDECIIEGFEANEHTFEQDGKMNNTQPEQEETNEQEQVLTSTWDFVEKYFPNYHSSDLIARSNDLAVICEDSQDLQEGSCAKKLFEEEFANSLSAACKEQDSVNCNIYEQAIQNFINIQSK